jgi:hypothetical protein
LAKGENLEKPKKKTGMVIVIGMGKPPKDSMKKSERQRRGRGSAGAKRAEGSKFFNRIKSGKYDIEEFARRRKIDPENLHGEIYRRHGMTLDDYKNAEKPPFDMQALIEELAEGAAGDRKTKRKQQNILQGLLDTDKFKSKLNAAEIEPAQWFKAVRREEEAGRLSEDTFNQLFEELRNKKGREFERKPRSSKMERDEAKAYEKRFADLDEQRAYENPTNPLHEIHDKIETEDDDDINALAESKMGRRNPSQRDIDTMERLYRVFQSRGQSPSEAAMQALRYKQTGNPYKQKITGDSTTYSGRNPKIHYAASDFNMSPYAGTGEFSAPRATTVAPAGSVESELSGFRGAKPIQFLPKERNRTDDEETDPLDIAGQTESLMQRKSEPMNIAWDILKGGMKTIDLIAQENRGNMEGAMESMKESFPNMPRDMAMKLIIEANNSRARDGMQESQMRNFPRLDDMEDPNERAMLPNQDNLAHESGNLPE